MSGILKQTGYQITAEGPLVKLQIGDRYFEMEYRLALDIAQDLRIVAHQAKTNAGDTSMTIRARGLLTDANSDEVRIQGLRDPTAQYN